MPCSACGWDNPTNSRFCNQCGVAQGPAASDALLASASAPPDDPEAPAPAARIGAAPTALADPPVHANGVEAELRRLAERVERLERRLAPDGLAPAPLSAPASVPAVAPSPRRASPSIALPAIDWRAVLAAARERAPAQAPSLPPRPLAVAALGALALILVVALLIGPTLWDSTLPALRTWLRERPLQVGIATALALLAALAAGTLAAAWPAGTPDRSLGRLVGAAAARAWRPGGVALALALAAVGEGLLLAHNTAAGVGCLGLALALGVWQARRGPTLEQMAPAAWHWRHEAPLAALVLLIGAFLRLFMIGDFPRGVDGDEIHWIFSAVGAVLAGEWNQWQATMIWAFAPFSMLFPTPFWIVFGPTIHTGRLMVALMSLAGNVLFYFLARRAFGVPVALVATLLLGICIGDVSASRLSFAEGQIKLWTVMAPFFAAWAVDALRRRDSPRPTAAPAVPTADELARDGAAVAPRSAASGTVLPPRGADTSTVFAWAAPLLYGLCALALLAGMFTFDTAHPMAAVVGLYLGLAVLVGLVRQPRRWPVYLAASAAFGVPILLATPRILSGMDIRRGAYTSVLITYGLDNGVAADKLHHLLDYFGTNLSNLLTSLFVSPRYGDFLLNRDGPWFNAALMPLFVVGLAWVLARPLRRHNGLVLLWLVLLYLPVALLIGSVWFRVMYAGLPAVVLLIGLGLWWTYAALAAALPRAWQPVLAAAFVGFLAVVTLFNSYIYFREVRDFEDRMHRREFMENVANNVAPGRMVYLAYAPNRGDFVEIDSDTARFAAWGKTGAGHEGGSYLRLPYADLLPSIFQQRGQYHEMRVVVEGPQYELGTDRRGVLSALERCFPGTTVQAGRYEVVYTLPGAALANPACTLDGQTQLVAPGPSATLPSGAPAPLAWRVVQGSAQQFGVEVQRRNDAIVIVEATSFSGPGWAVDTRFIDGFTGPGFLLDLHYRAEAATQHVQVPTAGTYEVWVRSARRVADDTHVFLDAGGDPREFSRPDATRLNQWVWESLGTMDLPAGPRSLTLTKDYGTAGHMAMFVDKVILSRDPTFKPEERGEWDTVLDSTVVATAGPEHRGPAPTLDPGSYRWRVQMRDGDRLIDNLGRTGLWTPYQEFTVR
jgi:hypothetical protein